MRVRDRVSAGAPPGAAQAVARNVAIGLVGYYPFVRGYPLGPELRERLEALEWPGQRVSIKEMNWGPIAIVQDFQASGEAFDRFVLVAAVDRGLAPGAVTARLWVGGKLDAAMVQGRMFEAVTGIISLDNLLVIGEHFRIWPRELITIEVQLSDNCIGELVLDELGIHQDAGQGGIVGQHPLAPDARRVVEKTVALARTAVTRGACAMDGLVALSAEHLNPLASVCHNQLIAGAGR